MTLKEEELTKPIGDFVIENATGVQREDGRYYHYSEVCSLIKKSRNYELSFKEQLSKVWHDVSEKPKKDEDILMYGEHVHDDVNKFHFGSYENQEGMRYMCDTGEISVVKWAYLKDLTPPIPEQP